MKFLQYRDQAHRNKDAADPHGVDRPAERSGQFLSAAPGGVWIVPHPRQPGDPKVAFFGHEHRGAYWVLNSEQGRPGQ